LITVPLEAGASAEASVAAAGASVAAAAGASVAAAAGADGSGAGAQAVTTIARMSNKARDAVLIRIIPFSPFASVDKL
jgi:hypothetical protein